MFDNTNPYTLRTKVVEGITHYYVSFIDGQAMPHEIAVSQEVYLAFDGFRKMDKRQRNFYERHIALHELSDEHINGRMISTTKGVDEIMADKELANALNEVIAKLPVIQRRRFILYYVGGLTYEKIARLEGCSKIAVKYTVDKATAAVMIKIEIF